MKFVPTIFSARQFVNHGHVKVNGKRVNIPSYTVKTEEEDKIHLTPESRFNEMLSEPESDLGSPETENLETKTDEHPKNEEQEVKQEVMKESTE